MSGERAGTGTSLADVCREAREKLDEALGKSPAELKEEVDEAERALVCLRDALIGRLRQEGAGASTGAIRPVLDRVNAVLSLVVAIEYPHGGLHRKLLEQARDALPIEELAGLA